VKRDGFVFYRSFRDALCGLNDEDFRKAAMAIIDYALDGIEPEGAGIGSVVFSLVKPQIDANNRRYENGKRGGRPKNNQTITKENQTETKNNQTVTKPKPNETNPEPKDKDKDKEKEKEYKDISVNNKNISEQDNIRVPSADADGAPAKEKRHKLGEYKHVLLTDGQLEKLRNDFGEQDTQDAITFLDEYIQRRGYKCKDYNLTLRNWVFDAVRERRAKMRGKTTARARPEENGAESWAQYFNEG